MTDSPPLYFNRQSGQCISSVLLKGTSIILKLKSLTPVNQSYHIQTSVSYIRFWIKRNLYTPVCVKLAFFPCCAIGN